MLDIETAVIIWRLLDAVESDGRSPSSLYVTAIVKLAEGALEEMENPHAREMLKLKLRRLARQRPTPETYVTHNDILHERVDAGTKSRI